MIDKRLRKTIRSTVPLLGGMAMGAMAFFGASHSAQGTTIVAGSDYVYTPADQSSLFEFPDPLGLVYFKGVPTFAGGTDTIVQRQGDCTFVSGTCTIPIEVTGLELMRPEFLTKSAIAKHRSLTGSGFEQSDRRFPQPTVCCQILS